MNKLDTYEKVENYLKKYQSLSYDIILYENKMGGLKAISYSQEEKGTAQDDMMLVYMEKIENCREQQKEIEKFIEDNFVGLDRLILHNKYVEGMTYKAIGKEVGYSTTHIKKLLNKAIYKYLAK